MSVTLPYYTKKVLATPAEFTPKDLSSALRLIITQTASDIHTASFLTALTAHKIDKSPAHISAAVSTMLEFSQIPQLDTKGKTYADIVGTGGDGQNTFNVSTSSAIVVAGVDGDHVVVKHGGKASTSTSGAGDLAVHLGIDNAKITAATVPDVVAANKFVFLFAPSFHDGMKNVAKIRRELGIPSIFNVLGPLLNPVPVSSRVLGVYSEELGPVYAHAARQLSGPSKHKYSTVVVWGECGLDELSPVGYSRIWYIDPVSDKVCHETVSPSDFGLPEHSLDSVRSGSAKENADILKRILSGHSDEYPAIRDYILLNSSLLAVSCGLAKDFKQGTELARKSILDGKALAALDTLCRSL